MTYDLQFVTYRSAPYQAICPPIFHKITESQSVKTVLRTSRVYGNKMTHNCRISYEGRGVAALLYLDVYVEQKTTVSRTT